MSGDILCNEAVDLVTYLNPPVDVDGHINPKHPTSKAIAVLLNNLVFDGNIEEATLSEKWILVGRSLFVFDKSDTSLVDQCAVTLEGNMITGVLKVEDNINNDTARVSPLFLLSKSEPGRTVGRAELNHIEKDLSGKCKRSIPIAAMFQNIAIQPIHPTYF